METGGTATQGKVLGEGTAGRALEVVSSDIACAYLSISRIADPDAATHDASSCGFFASKTMAKSPSYGRTGTRSGCSTSVNIAHDDCNMTPGRALRALGESLDANKVQRVGGREACAVAAVANCRVRPHRNGDMAR